MDSQGQPRKKVVLIIEDEPDVIAVYSQVLRDVGFDVLESQNGTEGLSIAQNKLWDLLLLDIMVPGEDGVHILKAIKNNPQINTRPVILLTNLDSETIINECFNLGADGYLIKSEITTDKIVSEVQNYLTK